MTRVHDHMLSAAGPGTRSVRGDPTLQYQEWLAVPAGRTTARWEISENSIYIWARCVASVRVD